MDIVQALILGIVQGIFEWLPVSSEAVITLVMTHIYGSAVEESVNTAIWLHTGTMLAAFLYFRKRFWRIIRYTYTALVRGEFPRRTSEQGVILYFIGITTVVTAVFGGFLYIFGIETIVNYPDVFAVIMAGALFLTGFLRLYSEGAVRVLESVGVADSVLVGMLQGLAVIPGISRSGSTVFGLLYRGFSAEDAFVLSFLISVPAVFIANIGINIFSGFVVTTELITAALAAFIVGYVSIEGVLTIADRAGIAYICFILGGISLLPLFL